MLLSFITNRWYSDAGYGYESTSRPGRSGLVPARERAGLGGGIWRIARVA